MFIKNHIIFSLLSMVLFMALVFPACRSGDTEQAVSGQELMESATTEPATTEPTTTEQASTEPTTTEQASTIQANFQEDSNYAMDDPIPVSKLPVLISGIDPLGITVDESGNLYIADDNSNRVLKVSTAGTLTTFAGNGEAGFSGDGGSATTAQLYSPVDVAFDSSGNLYIADELNRRIRKVTPEGTISTVAGGGDIRNGEGYSGSNYTLNGSEVGDIFDQEPADSVSLFFTCAVVVDNVGNIYFKESGIFGPPDLIQKVSPDGLISTFAGGGEEEIIRDDIPAASVKFIGGPAAVDTDGYLYVTGGNRVFEITPDGMIYIVAGTGTGGYSGDGGPAIEAELDRPSGIAVDEDGTLYIAEFGNNCIRAVTPDGVIYTAVDGLYYPTDVVIGPDGILFVAERHAYRVIKVEL